MLTGCPFCHHNNNSLYRENQALKIGGYRSICKCNECGLLYPEIRMDEKESAAYMSKYFSKQDDIEFEDPTMPFTMNVPIANFANNIEQKGKSLDIGTFDGRATYILKALGFDSYGLEYQEKPVEFARKHGLNVFKGTFPDDVPDNLLEQKYTLICMSEMIYYLTDLKKGLLKVHEMLEDGGFLLVKCHQGDSRYYTHAGNSYFYRFGDSVQGIQTVDSLLYCLKQTGFLPFQCGGFTPEQYYKTLNYTNNEIKTSDELIFLSQKQTAK